MMATYEDPVVEAAPACATVALTRCRSKRKPRTIIAADMMKAPATSSGLRPRRSTVTVAPRVKRVIVMPTTVADSHSAWLVEAPMFSNMCGAKYTTALMPITCWKMESMMPTTSTSPPKLRSGRVCSTSVALIACRVEGASLSPTRRFSSEAASPSRSLSTRKRGVSGTISMQMMSSSAGIAAEASMWRQAVFMRYARSWPACSSQLTK